MISSSINLPIVAVRLRVTSFSNLTAEPTITHLKVMRLAFAPL
jgi:hypothetical protein